MLLTLMKDPTYVPMKLKELAMLLGVPKEQRKDLEEVLNELVASGKVGISKKGKYARSEVFAQTGIFSAHHRGFGFVTIEGRDGDLFVPPDDTGDAMDGDTVQVIIDENGRGGRAEARVLKVLKHANETLIGTFEKNKSFGFVIPDNPRITMDIFIPQGKENGAVSGHKVVVKLDTYATRNKNPEGHVQEILGHINDPGVDILSIVRAYGLPEEFPEDVMEEVSHAPEELSADYVAEEIGKNGRVDLRDVPMVTIDGEDAKDLDDAVSVSKETINGETIYHLGVHIADVSHYVKEGTSLDAEAYKRGTSVYLVDRVIPMLPHRLSNGICSLNAGCDRLAMSCLMDIDEKGIIVGHKICESVVRIDRRMTYTAVNAILEAKNGTEEPQTDAPEKEKSKEKAEFAKKCLEEYADFVPMFLLLDETARVLRKKRMARGAVDFDFPECKIILDAKGRPVEIRPYERNAATMLIEDCMLAANETVAEDYYWQQIPFLYRSHEKPDGEKIKRFGILINNFGYSIRLQNGELHPKEMQKLLEKAAGSPEEALLARLALRSMKQAKYTTECMGHFGLAANYYTHFTSPIRRYPDLQIHRIIKENLHGGLTKKRIAHYEKILPEVAIWTSSRERLADEAERETDKAKKVQFMERHIGEEFTGVISGISNYGFYVELPNTVEGMVRLANLDGDYYVFDEEHYELVGERTRKKFKLGQTVKIQVVSVDRYLKTIDFLPVRNFDKR
ncbi:ribonuclease R [Clostridium sp. AF37-5AT]|nr:MULTISPECIES: ribonuclease R [unclassified Clostridium]RHO05845.1 ribonuclease R [Clostridium sp. AM22-16AC]RHO97728.1 ribonuclease R [Clostridium sp. AF37-5AT]